MPVLLSGKSGFENQNQSITKTVGFTNHLFFVKIFHLQTIYIYIDI